MNCICPKCTCVTYRIWDNGKLMERCGLTCGWEREVEDQRKEHKIVLYENRRTRGEKR